VEGLCDLEVPPNKCWGFDDFYIIAKYERFYNQYPAKWLITKLKSGRVLKNDNKFDNSGLNLFIKVINIGWIVGMRILVSI